MSNFDWGYPNTVWFGNGRIRDLPKACKVLGIKNPLFVTDKDPVSYTHLTLPTICSV